MRGCFRNWSQLFWLDKWWISQGQIPGSPGSPHSPTPGWHGLFHESLRGGDKAVQGWKSYRTPGHQGLAIEILGQELAVLQQLMGTRIFLPGAREKLINNKESMFWVFAARKPQKRYPSPTAPEKLLAFLWSSLGIDTGEENREQEDGKGIKGKGVERWRGEAGGEGMCSFSKEEGNEESASWYQPPGQCPFTS